MLKFRNILLIVLALFCFSQFYIYFYIYPADVSPGLLLSKIGQGLSVLLGKEPQKLVRINLDTYSLITFENGQLVKRYQMAAIGNPKISPTPKGNFKILQKNKKVFSGLSRVWMPWSLRFYRGYYIHEVPYYPSGERIKTRYSLGCIRLPLETAQEFYEWTDLGTRVEIFQASLAKTADNPAVYQLFNNGLRKHIISLKKFFSLGYQWKDIKIIPDEELTAYSEINLIQKMGDYRVYRLENGIKRWIKTAKIFEKLGYNWQSISPINAQEFDAYFIGSVIE